MLKNFFRILSNDIGIDLGTATTLVYVRGKGILINEPSVVAINQKTGRVLAVGREAKIMVGRTPAYIVATRPLKDGVISDFEVAEQMIKYFIDKASEKSFSLISRPRVVVGIPSGVTQVEKKAVRDATLSAGAKEVFLVEQPMASAIGVKMPVQEALGNMIVDIGGGTTDIAVISLGGIVTSKSLRIAGDELNEDIIQYARDEFNLLLGEKTAEEIKILVGSAWTLKETIEAPMRGRDFVTGWPKAVIVNDEQIRRAIGRSVKIIVSNVKATIEETPPELVADIMNRGIVMVGGGSLLRGIDKLVSRETQIPTRLADDPITAVVRGTGVIIENLDTLKNVLVSIEDEKVPT
ncbi:rod shape-determining protein [Patescibacteria group bacterium]|nr:rod shape-determining protein [Patescibacteria group bacterium]